MTIQVSGEPFLIAAGGSEKKVYWSTCYQMGDQPDSERGTGELEIDELMRFKVGAARRVLGEEVLKGSYTVPIAVTCGPGY